MTDDSDSSYVTIDSGLSDPEELTKLDDLLEKKSKRYDLTATNVRTLVKVKKKQKLIAIDID